MHFPENSRYLQNPQHLVGGAHNILLVLVGVYFGKNNTSVGVFLAVLTFIASRLSSEISYQTSISLMKEHIKNHEN